MFDREAAATLLANVIREVSYCAERPANHLPGCTCKPCWTCWATAKNDPVATAKLMEMLPVLVATLDEALDKLDELLTPASHP